jgi:antitoxin ParD1/3/4
MANDPHIVTMNVSLPQPLKQYVDRRVSSGIYGSASEFVREAIREKLDRDRERHDARDALTAKLLEGLDSGTPVPFKKGHFEKRKASLIRSAGRHERHS